MFINPGTLLLLSRAYGCPECCENVQNNQCTCQGCYFCKVDFSVQGTFKEPVLIFQVAVTILAKLCD